MQNKLEKGFILHHRPFSESSLMLDVFTESVGRLSIIAKGARRPKSFWRGLLVPFRPVLLSWVGRSELKTLTQAEADGKSVMLTGTRLWCGLYLNELLLRLLNTYDPHAEIYGAYITALQQLDGIQAETIALRRFERDLLQGLGYGLAYCEADNGSPIEPEVMYRYDPAQGFSSLKEAHAPIMVSGVSILALAAGEFEDDQQLKDAKLILQSALQAHLGHKPLQTRQLFQEVQRFF